jgi:hypothetical protein
MIEKLVEFITGGDRNLSIGAPTDEPSHIHLPRRRPARPVNAGNGTPWDATIGDHEFGTGSLAIEDRRSA